MKKLLATVLLLLSTMVWAQEEVPYIYGPVEPGDNLWHVAHEFTKHYDLSTEQAVGLLFQNNVSAFVHGDVNALMAGAFLTLPPNTPLKQPNEPPEHVASTVEPEVPEPQKVAAEEKAVSETLVQAQAPLLTAEEMLAEPVAPEPAIETPAPSLAENGIKPKPLSQKATPTKMPLERKVAELSPALTPELPEVTEGTQVASLELLMPNSLETLLGTDDLAFMKVLDKLQQELGLAKEAIETERRAKDSLESQLKDLQIQINALTELVLLKDKEISTMLPPQELTSNETLGANPGLWDKLPSSILLFLQQAGENQIVLLLIAIAIASLTMYLWDTFSANREPAQAAVARTATHTIDPSIQEIDTLIALGRYGEAITQLERLLAREPGNFNLLYKLCQVYVKDNQQMIYKKRLDRISPNWRAKYPAQWEQLNDLYELAWPMHFSADESHGGTYEGDPPSDPVQTKLDLARAYLDIGDHENAANILEEVLLEGNDQQSAAAQMLLDNIKR